MEEEEKEDSASFNNNKEVSRHREPDG